MIRTIRPKYACRACEAHVVQAPARPRVMDGGMATTALVAHVVVSKFAWHLPLYRQAQIFSGYGIHLDRGTLGGWGRTGHRLVAETALRAAARLHPLAAAGVL